MAIIPPFMIPSEAVVRINSPALLFSLGTTLISTLLFGLAPAVHAIGKDLREPLKASSKGGGESHRQNTVRSFLVVSEVTLSLVLLTGAGLLIRSFVALQHVELGCNLDHVLGTFLMLPEERYKTAEQRNQFHLELLRQVRELPGVVSAGLGNPWARELMTIELARKPSAENRRAWCSLLSDRVFETLEVPLDRGRAISEQDFVHASRVAVVNRALVTKFFEGDNPLGQRIRVTELETGPYAIEQAWLGI